MLSAGAIVSGAEHNTPLMGRYEFDNPYIYQVLGNCEKRMSEACRVLSERGCFSIDINMGCSAPDIIKKGSGAALLNDTRRTREIVRSCRKAVKTRLSVKMRTGFTSSNKERLLDFVKMLKDEGVDFITVHPRSAKISFKRKADWDLIRLIRENVDIPIIGNGDITEPETGVSKMLKYGCHGIMIGREAVKSPWIFTLCRKILNGEGSISLKVNLKEIFISTLLSLKKYLPPNLQKSRSLRFCYYFSGNVKFAHHLFTLIRQKEKIDDIIEIIDGYYARNPHEIYREFHYENGRDRSSFLPDSIIITDKSE